MLNMHGGGVTHPSSLLALRLGPETASSPFVFSSINLLPGEQSSVKVGENIKFRRLR